jgi:hypothetical protein
MNLAVSDIGKLLQDYGLSEDTTDIPISSWRPSTRQQYWTYFKKWLLFCSQRKVDPFKATEIEVLNFLTHLYKYGLDYSTLNTTRCMVSLYDNNLNDKVLTCDNVFRYVSTQST